MLDLYKLHHFLIVAKVGSYGRAAEELSMSQPALSRSIQSLERRVGARLLDRGRAGVFLTDVGKAFHEQAEQLLFHAENLQHNMDAIVGGEKGNLRFGIAPATASMFLPRLLEEFYLEYPLVSVQVAISSADEMHERLLDGDLEFYIASGNIRGQADPRIAKAILGHVAPAFFVRREHPLLDQGEVTVRDLRRFRLATGTAWNGNIRDVGTKAAAELLASIEVDNDELLVDLARKTDAILVASYRVPNADLVPLPLHAADIGFARAEVALFSLAGRGCSPVGVKVQDAIQSRFEDFLEPDLSNHP